MTHQYRGEDYAFTPDTARDECPDDNHTVGCKCHLGQEPIVGVDAAEEAEPSKGALFAPGGYCIPTQARTAVRAAEILHTAATTVSGPREADYGDAADDFTRTGKLWAAILGVPEVTAEQVALCMTAVKIGRLCTTPNHADSWLDIAGYAALGGAIAATEGRHI